MRKLSGAASLAAATATLALVVPGGISAAQTIAPKPDLKTLVAQAKQLEFQINSLSEQYDGLRIQLTRAQANAKIAQQAASRGAAALAVGQQAIAQLAAANYMNSGLDPTFQALTTGDPAQFLSQASAIAEIDQSSGVKVSTLSQPGDPGAARQADRRPADRRGERARSPDGRQEEAHQREDRQGQQRGDEAGDGRLRADRAVPEHHHPDREHGRRPGPAGGDHPGGRPLRLGAAGPAQFDCSGLVVWAYAQEGIALPHYTGSLWNSGMHVARSDLEPGDLVFFGADISHVGIYVGDGMMIDAPNFGETVQVEPIFWSGLRRRGPDRLRPDRLSRITEGHRGPGDSAWPAFLS